MLFFGNSFLPENVLILAPHPDDEVLGCGGLMSKMKSLGGKVTVAVATTNNSEKRLSELAEACEHFGVDDLTMFYPNSSFWMDAIPSADLVRHVERALDDYEPDAVLIPYASTFHQEHRALSHAALAAMRPSGATGRHRPNMIAMYEEPFDSWTIESTQFRPTFYIPLSAEDIDNKVIGMEIHASQARPAPSERSAEAIRSLAAYRGSQCGSNYAEAYEIRYLKA